MKELRVAQVLRAFPLFTGLDEFELEAFSKDTTRKLLNPGESLYLEGDLLRHLYILIEGRMKCFVVSSVGREFILGFLEAGEVLGLASVFRGKPTASSMQAVVPSIVLGVGKEAFSSFLMHHPSTSFELIKILNARISEMVRRLRDLAGARVDQRIARILYMLSSRLGSTLPFTRQEIAGMAGTTTETAIRVMSHLRRMGIIDSVRGKIIIPDPRRLKKFIEQDVLST